MFYLNLDENNYLLSVATVGGGVEAEIDLANYDLSGGRIRAYKWENDTLIFDAAKFAEIEAEKQTQQENEPQGENNSVYDELAAAYRQGVQEA